MTTQGQDLATTLRQDLAAITLTPTAKAAAQAGGADLQALVRNLDTHLICVRHALTEILRLHPSTGGDATNYEAFRAMLTKIHG